MLGISNSLTIWSFPATESIYCSSCLAKWVFLNILVMAHYSDEAVVSITLKNRTLQLYLDYLEGQSRNEILPKRVPSFFSLL